MKKIIFLLMISVLLLTGCGKSSKNQIVCTGKVEESGYKATVKVVANFKDDKITNANAEVTLDNKEITKTICLILASTNENLDEENKMTYECKDKTIKITNFSKFSGSDNENSVIGKSKENFIKNMEERSFSCK